jgi:hypothetical protein
MKPDQNAPANERDTPDAEHLHAAVTHLGESIDSGHIASSAAKGILYSLVETLGVLVGDPNLPEHARSGYEGLLEVARELRAKLGD